MSSEPTKAMLEAGDLFHQGRIDEGLDVLRRDFTADDRLPAEFRAQLVERVAVLAEAAERDSTAHAETARFGEDHGPVVEERPTQRTLTFVDLVGWWNGTVRHFIDALDDRERARRGGRQWNVGIR